MRDIVIEVEGIPVPQGSKTCICRGGKPTMFEQAKGFGPWRTKIRQAAREHTVTWSRWTPLAVSMLFYFPTTDDHYADEYVVTKPDIDKLVRAVLDGLTFDNRGRGVLPDDCQVARLVVEERYGDPPGVIIGVADLSSD